MKKMMAICIALSILCIAGVSYAGLAQIMFADQDMPVGTCGVFGVEPNPAPWQVCVECRLVEYDSVGAWCGDEVKWDTGVEAAAGSVITITQTKKNNPIPGLFPYGGPFINGDGLENFNECHTSFFECAPAIDACSGTEGPIVAAIHADIFNDYMDETAWTAECLQYGPDGVFGCQEWGTEFAGKNWATYVHVPCYTGLPGACGAGVLSCHLDSVGPYCASINTEPEVCDGIDNDCDGVIDNGNPGGGISCDTGQPGECSTGTTQCSGGSIVCEPDNEPIPEVCDDGIDNDCDGLTDGEDVDNCPGVNVCDSGPTNPDPGIIMEFPTVYWASMADYTNGILSTSFYTCNSSTVDINNLTVIEAYASNGVTLENPLPALVLGTVVPGDCWNVDLQWNVGAGTSSFWINLVGTADGYPDPFEMITEPEGCTEITVPPPPA